MLGLLDSTWVMEGMEVDTEREGSRDVEARCGDVRKAPWKRGVGRCRGGVVVLRTGGSRWMPPRGPLPSRLLP